MNNKCDLKVLLYFAGLLEITYYLHMSLVNAVMLVILTYAHIYPTRAINPRIFANSILVTRNDYWLQLIEIYYIFYLCVCICAKKDALKHWAIILDLKSLITVVCSQSKLQGNIYVLHICPKTQNRQTKKQKVRCQPFRFASL